MQKLFILLALIVGFACQNKKDENNSSLAKSNDTQKTVDEQKPIKAELLEFFADSSEIGVKGKNKLEISSISLPDNIHAIVKFYTKLKKKWLLKDSFDFITGGISNLNVDVLDFNTDGFKDFSFHSSTSARGANEIRTLFIYDEKKDWLIHIKNSEQYANLQYNSKLKCVDAFNVWGGSMSYFLNIVGDSLKPFASVELNEGLTITEYDKHGNEKIIRQDTSIKHSYGRYKSYNPLIEYEDY